MKRTTAKIAIFAMALALFLLGCKDAFHDPGWDPNTATYEQDGIIRTITFNANGGSGTAPGRQSAQSGETMYLPGAGSLSRSNYTFGGWDANAAGTGAYYPPGSLFTVPNQDVILYARWDALPDGGGTNPGNPITVPNTPTNVNAGATSSSSITVSWSAVSGAKEYYVYRMSETTGAWVTVRAVSGLSYNDTGLVANTTYQYSVSAFNSAGGSPQSSPVSATTMPSAPTVTVPSTPTGVTATAASSSSITVSWTSVTGATGYRVYRSASSSGTYNSVGEVSATSFTDTGLLSATTYYYKVSAYNSAGESPQSSAVSVTIPTSNQYDGNFIYSDVAGDIWIVGYTGTSKSVTIPSQINGKAVVSIAYMAFRSKQLTSVSIPNSVTTIAAFAFAENQLTNITIGNSVTTIGMGAFETNQLTSVTIPNSVTTIEATAFYDNRLTSVTIGNSVTIIGDGAFQTNQLTNVTIPNSVTIIESTAFCDNRLTSVTIPNSVTNIGMYAFARNLLTSVNIGNSVKTIGNNAFESNKLVSVTIPNSVTNIGEYAFARNLLTSVNIGNSVTNIGLLAFAWNQLTSITIPNNVKTIGGSAFDENQLISITIGANVSVGMFMSGDSNFTEVYAANSKSAGTYVRDDVNSFWRKL